MTCDRGRHNSHEGTPPNIFVLTGVMASGKSTVAQLLAEKFSRGVHLRGDIFRKMIVGGRENFSPNSSNDGLQQLRLRYEITTSVADKYFNAGFRVVAQDVILGSFLMEFIQMTKSRMNMRLRLAHGYGTNGQKR
ncbi:AAA family ATPase [Alicyclobacillus curvatus]|nr:AAA family ATPase [Alicyclobacillus curvatus]